MFDFVGSRCHFVGSNCLLLVQRVPFLTYTKLIFFLASHFFGKNVSYVCRKISSIVGFHLNYRRFSGVDSFAVGSLEKFAPTPI